MIAKLLNQIRNWPKEKLHASICTNFKVPELAHDPQFVIKIAETKDELEAAYRLVYKCYADKGLTQTNNNQMRYTIHAFLPDTTCIIALYNNQIIGTASLVMDNCLGLPTDHEYKKENDYYRRRREKILEMNSMAVDPLYRHTGHAISLLLFKYAYNFCFNLSANRLVCNVHPKVKNSFLALWGFETSDRVLHSASLNMSPTLYMSLPLTKEHRKSIFNNFKKHTTKENPAIFLVTKDSRFIYPKPDSCGMMVPVHTPETLEYFFLKKPELFQGMNLFEQSLFFEIFEHYYGPQPLTMVEKSKRKELRKRVSYRVPVQIPCMVQLKNMQVLEMGVIRDLSSKGCYIQLMKDSIKENQIQSLVFKIENDRFEIPISIKWVNRGQNLRLGAGFGLEFASEVSALSKYINRYQSEFNQYLRGQKTSA